MNQYLRKIARSFVSTYKTKKAGRLYEKDQRQCASYIADNIEFRPQILKEINKRSAKKIEGLAKILFMLEKKKIRENQEKNIDTKILSP